MESDYIFTESDRTIVLKHLRESYEADCELCGEDSEEAEESKALYRKVLSKPLEENHNIILGFYAEMSDAVNWDIENYYQSEPDLIDMIKKLFLSSEKKI